MINYSALNTQNIVSSSLDVETKTAAEIARENAEEQKVEFLEILLTQLVNQNPLDPMDTDEFSAQLTRYSILEQGIDTNENLTVISDTLQSGATAASFSYIGKTVEVGTNANTVQDGMATWSYVVEGSADEVYLTFTDEDGNSIVESEGSISTGVQSFDFDASSFGLEDGATIYMSINATDNDGNKLNTETTSSMTVEGVWSDQTGSYLSAGSISFLASDVLKLVEGSDSGTEIASTETDETE